MRIPQAGILAAVPSLPFKRSLGAVSHAWLACSLPAALALTGCGLQAGSAPDAESPLAMSQDPWFSEAAELSNPTRAEFALFKTACLSMGAPRVDDGTGPEPGSGEASALPDAQANPCEGLLFVDKSLRPSADTAAPADTARAAGNPKAALAAKMGVGEADVWLVSDLEDQDPACWGNRQDGFNRTGCGPFRGIGSFPLALSADGIAHSGKQAMRITYAANEELGGSNVGILADTVNVRTYFYFDQGFDFGQGMKIGRVQSFNAKTQMNDVDVILQCRSVNGANQCGMTDMYQLGLHYNGRPLNSDWGAVSADVKFERGKWYAVEYQVILNTPGRSDGIGRMWVDGKLVGERKDLRIRGSFGAEVKLNTVRVGGWYSNGGGGNSCANPSQPSRIYMDDVAIAKGYIGT